MKVENQNVEFKESWRDEYIKWICGFANAHGGTIFIGVRDDGTPCGVKDAKKLMEGIPNKVRDILGIVVDVDLVVENGLDIIKITTTENSYPVNYRGEYHYRSGSTKQLLQGAALTSFLLQKTGKKWDSVPIDGVSVSDLDKESFDIFRREALRSGRMSNDDLKLTDEQLLDNLNLLESGKLKRAAILLFHRRPEKWITGAFVKIGYFETDADLRYQDEIQGSLMIQADRVIELIYTKYLKAEISYDNITRIEHYPFPKDAIREAVFNALIHQDFAASIPVQISVYEDKLYISNDCVFPQNWTVETLLQKHRSLPHNPDIANAFFRAGFIESWGRGIEKICTLCKNYGIPEPKYTIHPQDIMALFTVAKKNDVNEDTAQKIGQICENEFGINEVEFGIKFGINQEKFGIKFGENDLKVITAIEFLPSLTAERVAHILNITVRGAEKIFQRLRSENIITRQGSKKTGHWEVIQNPDKPEAEN